MASAGMTVTRAEIPYAPRSAFLPFHMRSQRWAVLVAHRRAGKTVSCVNDLIRAAITCPLPEARFAYIAPLYVQAKDVAWVYLKRFAAPLLASAPNESELRVDLVNGARIRLYGADNPDRLRGLYLDGVVLDEYADMHPGMWGEVIRPALADRQGWATFIGTPKGRNAFFELFVRAQSKPDEWFADRLRASETGLLPSAELDDARDEMTPEQFEQEFECSFDAAIMGAYYGREMAEAERTGRIGVVPYDPALPVHTAWDLGRGQNMAIWVWQAVHGEIRVIDYLSSPGLNMQSYCAELDARGWRGGDDWVPHDARVPSLETDRTRVETLVLCGRRPRIVPMHKVDDGINGARVLFSRVHFDAIRCKEGLEALRQYRTEWDDKARVYKLTPKHDWASHPADAFRYLCMGYREVSAEPRPPTAAERRAADRAVVAALTAPRTFDDMLSEDRDDD